jgi:hypothetical protein
VATSQHRRCCVHHRVRDANHVLAELFESLVEGLLIVLTLAFTETAKTRTVADVNQHSSMVYPVQRSNICDAVRVYENQHEIPRVENFAWSSLEIPLWSLLLPLLWRGYVTNLIDLAVGILEVPELAIVFVAKFGSVECVEVLHLLTST